MILVLWAFCVVLCACTSVSEDLRAFVKPNFPVSAFSRDSLVKIPKSLCGTAGFGSSPVSLHSCDVQICKNAVSSDLAGFTVFAGVASCSDSSYRVLVRFSAQADVIEGEVARLTRFSKHRFTPKFVGKIKKLDSLVGIGLNVPPGIQAPGVVVEFDRQAKSVDSAFKSASSQLELAPLREWVSCVTFQMITIQLSLLAEGLWKDDGDMTGFQVRSDFLFTVPETSVKCPAVFLADVTALRKIPDHEIPAQVERMLAVDKLSALSLLLTKNELPKHNLFPENFLNSLLNALFKVPHVVLPARAHWNAFMKTLAATHNSKKKKQEDLPEDITVLPHSIRWFHKMFMAVVQPAVPAPATASRIHRGRHGDDEHDDIIDNSMKPWIVGGAFFVLIVFAFVRWRR